MAITNSINAGTTGVVGFNGTAFSASAVTQYDVLVGGSTSSTISSVGPGTAGQVLQSGGNAANPAYSTATFPATAGTSGNVLVSEGTNWNSQVFTPPATGTVITVQVTLTSAQVKALNATPITLVAAPGAGLFIKLVQASSKLNYGGSNVFIAGASQNIGLYYGAGGTAGYSGSSLMTNATLTANTTQYNFAASPAPMATVAASSLENKALVIQNPVATEITGNAANNNTIVIAAQYCIISG